MTKKITTEDFISKAIQIHGNTYEYGLVVYTKSSEKVVIICKTHGEFQQTPDNHLKDKGCRKCGSERTRKSSSQFISEASEVHGTLYDYKDTLYTTVKEPVSIICKIHGQFTQLPEVHLSGCGCPKCGEIASNNKRRKTLEEFILSAEVIHGHLYDYSKFIYSGAHSKSVIICPVHGDFIQSPGKHLQGRGCPRCSKTGFDPSKPGILYYLSINEGQAYKIGITNRSITDRFNLKELSSIKVLSTWDFGVGAKAYTIEQKILSLYKDYRYTGPDLLSSDNTELFSKDVLPTTSENEGVDREYILPRIY